MEKAESFSDSQKWFKNKKKSRMKRLKKYWEVKSLEMGAMSDTWKYLMRVAEVIETVRSDEHEMGILAENVFNEVQGNEILYAKLSNTSKLLEDLLPYATGKDFNEFIKPFVENLRPVFTDQITCHVLQKITIELLKRMTNVTDNSDEKKAAINYPETILKIAGFALNNLEDFIWNLGSNHAMRTIISVLGGVTEAGNTTDVPPEFHSTFVRFVKAIIDWQDFGELCSNTITSGFLQNMLTSSKAVENGSKAIIKKIIKQYKGQSVNVDGNEPILRLIEVALEVATEKQIKKISKVFLRDNLKELALSKTGNFAIQKLIRHCIMKERFEEIFTELQEIGEDILMAGNTGVLLELAQCCLRLKIKQGEFIKMMMQILKCKKTMNEDSDIAPLTCCMVISNLYDPEMMRINLHGSLIVQAMLSFGKPIKVINSILNMETKHLVNVICDPRGCHIVDAFMQSKTVGEKSRDRLFKKLLGYYTQLAISKHGSRAMDAIWSGLTTKSRVQLMEELCQNESKLMSNQYGKFFARKKYLSHFRRNKDEWINHERTIDATVKRFADILPPAKKQKLET